MPAGRNPHVFRPLAEGSGDDRNEGKLLGRPVGDAARHELDLTSKASSRHNPLRDLRLAEATAWEIKLVAATLAEHCAAAGWTTVFHAVGGPKTRLGPPVETGFVRRSGLSVPVSK